ncbi:MAG TPA: phosphopantetheine-binding protein [Pirellulaceae bacterium]
MHDRTAIVEGLLSFLRTQTGRSDLNPDTRLITSGLLDSLLVMDVVGYVESAFQVRLVVTDLIPDNLDTVERLSAMIARRSGTPAHVWPETPGGTPSSTPTR